MSLAPSDLAAWESALGQIQAESKAERYHDDPVAWARDVLHVHPWSRQADIMRAVAEQRLVAVQSAHGVGKTRLASWLVLWFLATRPARTTRVVTSAPTAHQVRAVLWEYIRQGHEVAQLPGYITQGQVPEWKIDGHLVAYGRRPSDHQQSSFQGSHADHLLVILDEAGGIPKWLWDASDSLMTGDKDQHLLAIGNPDDNSSHFQTVCSKEPRWTRFKVSAFDSPAFTDEDVPDDVRSNVVGPAYVEDKLDRWGKGSPLYKVKVLGEFVDSEDGLIPLAWVAAANQRWNLWREHYDGSHQPHGRTVFGVDVGHLGEDRTVIATRKGDIVMQVESWVKQDTVATIGLTKARLATAVDGVAVVDGIGIGAGVVDRLRHDRQHVHSFIASRRTKRRDSSGELKFSACRSAAWWNMRELLDPALGSTVALPPDDDLTADLTTPKWEIRTGGVVQVESKDDIRRRLGRSTDFGDAVVQSFWIDTVNRDDEDDELRPLEYADANGWIDY